MIFTHLKTAALLSLVVLGSAISEAAQRERPAAPAAPAMAGKVVEVAKDGKSFTVETAPAARGEAPGKAVVKFGEKVAVTFNGVGPDGAKPTEGYVAQVWLAEGSKDTAATVTFSGHETAGRGGDIVGVVSAVAKDGKSVEVTVGGARGEQARVMTVPLDAKTALGFSNVAKDGAKLANGQRITVWYADDGKNAGKVQVYGAGEPGRRDEKRPDAAGKVVRAAADGSTLVIEIPPTERGGEATRMTVKIGDKATTVFNNVPTDGAKIAAGLVAQVWLLAGEKEAAAKVVFTGTVPERWTTIAGKVVAVAKDGSSITVEGQAKVRGEEAKRVEVKLTAKTKVAYFGVGAGEAKPAEGLMASIRFLDGSADTAAHVTFTKGAVVGRGR